MSRTRRIPILLVALLVVALPAEGPAQDRSRGRREGIAGGRDVRQLRDPKLVWSEMLENRAKLYEVADDRDMRAIVLTTQERALLIAFSKRIYDLDKELLWITQSGLTLGQRVRVTHALRRFDMALDDLNASARTDIHREIPRQLDEATHWMKGIWQAFPHAEVVLGSEGLPSDAELRARSDG